MNNEQFWQIVLNVFVVHDLETDLNFLFFMQIPLSVIIWPSVVIFCHIKEFGIHSCLKMLRQPKKLMLMSPNHNQRRPNFMNMLIIRTPVQLLNYQAAAACYNFSSTTRVLPVISRVFPVISNAVNQTTEMTQLMNWGNEAMAQPEEDDDAGEISRCHQVTVIDTFWPYGTNSSGVEG